jgi:hypothetical protein
LGNLRLKNRRAIPVAILSQKREEMLAFITRGMLNVPKKRQSFIDQIFHIENTANSQKRQVISPHLFNLARLLFYGFHFAICTKMFYKHISAIKREKQVGLSIAVQFALDVL